MTDCIFCNIINGSIPTQHVYEDDIVVAFDDLNPQAPHHTLIVPKMHIATLNEISGMTTDNPIGHIAKVAATLAETLGISKAGYRFVINCNGDGGQTVFHIHAHLLGGRHMNWPPG